jgi:hypothetical protein
VDRISYQRLGREALQRYLARSRLLLEDEEQRVAPPDREPRDQRPDHAAGRAGSSPTAP